MVPRWQVQVWIIRSLNVCDFWSGWSYRFNNYGNNVTFNDMTFLLGFVKIYMCFTMYWYGAHRRTDRRHGVVIRVTFFFLRKVGYNEKETSWGKMKETKIGRRKRRKKWRGQKRRKWKYRRKRNKGKHRGSKEEIRKREKSGKDVETRLHSCIKIRNSTSSENFGVALFHYRQRTLLETCYSFIVLSLRTRLQYSMLCQHFFRLISRSIFSTIAYPMTETFPRKHTRHSLIRIYKKVCLPILKNRYLCAYTLHCVLKPCHLLKKILLYVPCANL
jgi:hypothetical protein